MAVALTQRRILTIAFPIILSNATVPLLGAVDTAVIGDKEMNIRNKFAGGKFTAAFLLQCPSVVGMHELKFFAYGFGVITISLSRMRSSFWSCASSRDFCTSAALSSRPREFTPALNCAE